MKKLYEIKNSFKEKLEELAGREVTSSTIELAEKLTTVIKNIDKIIMCAEKEGEYSGESRYGGYGYGGNNIANINDGSYARGRGRYAKRDSMGRYSRDDGYSRDEMSGMVEDMREMMSHMPAGKQRKMEELIRQLEDM